MKGMVQRWKTTVSLLRFKKNEPIGLLQFILLSLFAR